MTEPDLLEIEELMGEIQRRLKILDSVAVILEKYPDSGDKWILDEIRSTMKRYLDARAISKLTGEK